MKRNIFIILVFTVFLTFNSSAQCPVSNSCTPGNAPTYNDFGTGIFNVTLNTINNSTGGMTDGYKDYSCTKTTTLTAGVNYTISITTGSPYNEDVKIWIDYNNNGTFDPTTELAFTSDNKQTHTGTINIPSSAVKSQPLRMRVSSDFGTPISTPCATSEYSQTEDYGITVVSNTNAPVSQFNSGDTITCSGQVNFKDLSTNIPTSWKWYFGDGDSSSLQNPSHTYTSFGTYNITLKTVNSNGSNTLTKNAYIKYNYNAPIGATCTPLTTNYCCLYGIYKVVFNNINHSSADASEGYKDFSCLYQTSLTEGRKYNLSITTNSQTNQDTKAWIDFNNDGIFNNTNELVFQYVNQKNPSALITIPGGAVLNTPLRMRISSDYAGSSFDACTYLTNGQAEDYAVKISANTAAPETAFTVDKTSSCTGTFIFSDTSSNAVTSRIWYFGDGTTSTATNPSHVYSSSGVYTVKLKTCNTNGCDSLTKVNYINYQSPCYCTSTGSNNYYYITNVKLNTIDNSTNQETNSYGDYTSFSTDLMKGSPYNLSVSDNYGGIYHIAWIDYNKDGVFDSSEQIMYLYGTPTTSTFTIPTSAKDGPTRMRVMATYYNVTSACSSGLYGEVEDYTINILPNTIPPVSIFYSNNTINCTGIVSFKDTSKYVPTSWLWNFGDGTTSTVQNPSHVYNSYGVYTIKLKTCNAYGCDSTTRTNYINYSSICPYCKITSSNNSSYYISNVTFNTINNSSTTDPQGFGDYTSVSTNLTLGNFYNLKISDNYVSGMNYYVWIDYNKDGSYSSSEQVLSLYGAGTVNKNISIPSIASTGLTHMRVIASYYTSYDACTNISIGEIEDYTINIVANTNPPDAEFYSVNTVICDGIITLRDTSTNIPTSWLWDFGDGTTSTVRNPSHAYNNYGKYSIKLKTCNSFGCDSIVKNNFINYSTVCPYCTSSGTNNSYYYISNVKLNTINNTSSYDAGGYGDFTSLSTDLTLGESYNLMVTDYGSTYLYFYAWIDYNQDGIFTSNEQVLSDYGYTSTSKSIIIPANAITGSTRLRVITSYQQQSATCGIFAYGETEDYSINIIANTKPPVPDFYSKNTMTCNSIVSFKDSSKNIPTSYLWNFGDGTTSTVQNPSHGYNSYGQYTITLKTCNANGCDSIKKTNYINYSATCPYCTISVSPNSNYYISNVKLNTINNTSVNNTGGYGDYTSISTNLTIGKSYNLLVTNIYTSSLYYYAWIDYNQDGVFSSSEQVLNTSSYTTVNKNIVIPTSASSGQTRLRILTSYNSAANACGNLTYGEAEDYTVNIIPNVTPPVTDFYSNTTLTCNNLVSFKDTTQNLPTSWIWDFGDGTTSNVQNPSHAYQNVGTYTVKLKTCNAFGCDSVTKINYINYSSQCPYCSVTSSYNYSYYISNVSLNTINNYSSYNTNGYGDYTYLSTNLIQGQSYAMSVSNYNYNYLYAWIDYNRDGVFSASEALVNGSYNYGYLSFSISIPTTSSPGQTRLRVMASYYTSAGPCSNLAYGEIEDYNINISSNTTPPVVGLYGGISTCNGTINFTDSTQNNPTSWLWDFGDGTTSTLQNPSHSYGSYGSYSVSLKACNAYGCDSVKITNYINYTSSCAYCTSTGNSNYYIYISNVSLNTINNYSSSNANGYGDFTSISTNLTAGQNYTLSVSSSSYAAYSDAWIDFNQDGTFSSNEQVFTSSSAYSVAKTITIPSSATQGKTRMRVILNYSGNTYNPCTNYLSNGETEDYSVNIIPNTLPPVANFKGGVNTCTGTVYFTDSTRNAPTSWLWNFGDGTTSTLQSPSHTYSSYGTYTVSLKTCNTYGCDSIKKTNYTTYSSVCPHCTSTGHGNSIMHISNVSLSNLNNYSNAEANGYGDYTSLAANVSNGQYYTLSVTVSGYPAYIDAWIDYNQDGTFSSNEKVISSFAYYSTSQSMAIPYNAYQGKTIMRVIMNYSYTTNDPCVNGLTYGEVEDYSINITNSPTIDFSSNNIITCNPTVSFTDLSIGSPTSWLWSFGDGTTSTAKNPVHAYSSYGQYNISLKACNSYGCDSLKKLNYINYSTQCAYCISTGNYNYSSYISYVSLNTLNNPSSYDANGYGDYTSLSTNLKPGSSYTISVNTGNYGAMYYAVWIDYNRDGIFASSERTGAYGASGSYAASMTINVPSSASLGYTRMRVMISSDYSLPTNSCSSGMYDGEVEDYGINLTYANGISGKVQDASFQIFPNPSGGIFTIDYAAALNENITMQIINNLGQVVKEDNFHQLSAVKRDYDISDLSSGIYIVKVISSKKIISQKLIKE